MSTFEFVERTNNSSLKASESAILRGHEVAKLTGTLLVLSLPANAPDTSSAHVAHGMAVPPGGSTPSTGASWVETQFDVFHTKLTMHDVIPDAPSAKVSTYHNPPKPHGHPHHPRHGVPMIRRDFVFATTPVELSMVGSSNPPMIQNIVGKIQFDGQTADDLMFKMTWTNQVRRYSGHIRESTTPTCFLHAFNISYQHFSHHTTDLWKALHAALCGYASRPGSGRVG